MGRHVLLIEDEPNISEAIRFLLSRDGWQVNTHSNGHDAVEAVQVSSPDLVILDVMLPSMNGLDVLRALRTTSAVPLLMLTARGEDIDRIIGLEFDGKAIDDEKAFLVVSNNYRASGGGNFPAVNGENVAIKAPNENRQVVADYIAEQAQANKDGFDPSADNNWSFKAINNSVVVTLRSAPSEEAAEFAKGLAQLKETGTTDADGFAVYQLDLSK